MYKTVITHEIMPGKLPDVMKWIQGNYNEMRRKDPTLTVPGDPDYNGPARSYLTVYGSAYQFVVERDTDTIPDEPYTLATHNKGLLPFLVPGRTVVQLLKLLEFK